MDGNGYYYICCATAQMQTNLLALFAHEPASIRGILLLIGVVDPGRPTDVEVEQAIKPAERFAHTVRLLNYPSPKPMRGHPASFADWQGKVRQWAQQAGSTDGFILNITGGPRPMSVGAQDGLAAALGENALRLIKLVYVDRGADLVTRNASPERCPLGELTLEQHLAMHGYVESERSRAQRLTRQREAIIRRPLTEALWREWRTDQHLANGLNLMIDAVSKVRNTAGAYTVGRTDLSNAVTNQRNRKGGSRGGGIGRVAIGCLDSLLKLPTNGLVSESGGMISVKAEAVPYLKGGWFEEFVYLMVQDQYCALGHRGDAVHLGVKIRRETASGPSGEEDRDLDVAFLWNGLVHVIECKTAAYSQAEERRQLIHYLMAVRQELTGLHGLVGLAHSREIISATSPAARRAKEAGIFIWQSHAGLKQMRIAVRSLLLSRRARATQS